MDHHCMSDTTDSWEMSQAKTLPHGAHILAERQAAEQATLCYLFLWMI
jgi:hypothetical protein